MSIGSRRLSCCWPRTLLATLALVACTRRGPSAPPPPVHADPPPPTAATTTGEVTHASSTPTCRDFRDLDVQSLPPLPSTPYTATFEQVWRTVLDKHYDPTLGCLDWPAIRIEYGQALAQAPDQAAAFEVMRQMLARLQQSHLALTPPRTKVAGEPRAAVPAGDGRLPLQIRMIDDVATVVDPAWSGHPSGIPGGAQVLAIGEHELAELLADPPGPHLTRKVEVTFAIRRVINSWLHCPVGTKVSVRYQALGAKAPKTRKIRCHTVEAERLSLGNIRNVPSTVEHRMVPDTTVGYITFNIWLLPLLPKIEAALADLRARGMTALVIDLRGNPGGLGAMVVPLGRQLLSEATDLGVMHTREGKQTFNVAAGTDPFTGPVALLVDEGTASTSEIFAQALKDRGRARIYGAVTSQGAALPSMIDRLPDGAILQYVVADYKSPSGTMVEGQGVVPDTLVPETRRDFAQGRDPVLEAAVADLRTP
ncbi:MAG: S41 family peptidase [Myxococcota bacterium]